jgi:hypothetical protein
MELCYRSLITLIIRSGLPYHISGMFTCPSGRFSKSKANARFSVVPQSALALIDQSIGRGDRTLIEILYCSYPPDRVQGIMSCHFSVFTEATLIQDYTAALLRFTEIKDSI